MKELMNPFIAQEKPLKTSMENINRSGFSLQSKTPKLGKNMRKWRTHGVVVTLSTFSTISTQKMREYCFLKCKKKPLI